jgi:hypothetical protein
MLYAYIFLPRRRFVTETFWSGDVLLQETFCYGDVLLRRRFVTETFCMETFCRGDVLCGDVLYVRRSLVKLAKFNTGVTVVPLQNTVGDT